MIYLKEGRTPLNFAYSDEIVHDGNSTYQLSFKFPTNNPLWEELVEETLLLADDLHGEQEFIIFEVEKHHAYISVHANQVATLLNNYSITELSVNNASGDRVMRSLVGSIIRDHKFTFSSDIASTHSINLKNVTVATALFKDKHSILGQWGGDLIRDKYDIRLLSNGGTNKEALFMYKKNLKSYQQKKSIKDLRTRIHFTKTISAQKEGEKDKVIAVTVDSPLISKYKNIYEGNLDVSDQDVIDEVTLRKYGEQYYKTTLCDVIEESIEIDVVGNPDVPVRIFDTVTIFHEKFNLDVKKKITKYTFSSMGRKLKTIGFGKIQQGLGTTLASMIDDAVTEHVESQVDAFKIQKNLSELLKLDRKSIEDKLVDLEEKSNSALEVKKALFEADGNIPDVVKTKILDAVEAEVGRLKTIITEAELIKAIQAKLDYAEIKNTLIDKAFINQIISDERFTQQFKDGEVTTQNIFTKLKDSIKSNISKEFMTKEGVKKLVNDLTIDADGIRQITQEESSKVFEKKKSELKGIDSYIHKKYSDYADGRNMSDNSMLKYIGIYTGDKQQAPTNASEYSWTKIRGEDGRNGVDGKDGEVEFNLLKGTKEFNTSYFAPPDVFQRSLVWVDEIERYEDFAVKSTIYQFNGLWQNVELEKDKTYEYGFYAKGSRDTDRILFSPGWPSSSAKRPLAKYNIVSIPFKLTTAWKFYSFRFTVTETGWSQCRVEKNEDNNGIKLNVCGMYLKEVKNNQQTPLGWSPSIEDLQGHSLTANVRFEGTYVKSVTNNLKTYLDVFYDGQKVDNGFEVKYKTKGANRTDWSDFINGNVDNIGRIINLDWGNREQNGQPIEVIVLVTYKGLNTIANARIDNIPDVTEIRDIVNKYKTFDSTLELFNSTIGEVKQQVLANEEKRNLILGSRMLSESDFKKLGGSVDLTLQQEYQGLPYLSVFQIGKTSNIWQGVGFDLSLTRIKKGETYSIRIPMFVSESQRPDEGSYVEIKNHDTREILWKTRLDTNTYPIGNWNTHEYTFTASKDMNITKSSFWIYHVRNGYLAFAKPYMCEGNTLPKNYSPAPEDFYLQNSRIESSIIQTKNAIDLKVSKDNVIASINASVEKNEQGQNHGVVKIKGEVLADNIHGKTFTGSKFKIGQYGFLQPIEKGLQINAPENFGSKRGIGLQIAGEGVGPKERGVPPGLFIYEDPDFTKGNSVPNAVNRVLLTVAGMACFSSRISGSVVKGQPILTNLDSNFPFSSTYPVKFIGYQEGGFMRFFGTDNDNTNTWNIKVDTWGSDRKLKTDIKESKFNAIEFVEKLKFKDHGWNKDEVGYERPHTKCGLIAQELQELDESLVVDYGKYLGLDGLRLINISLKANQELSEENKMLKSQLKEMNERLQKLEDKINGEL